MQAAIKPIVPLARTMPIQINFFREFGRTNRAHAARKTLNEEVISVGKEGDDGVKVVKTRSERAFDVFDEVD